MTISSIPTIIGRIKVAQPDSPLAVFSVTTKHATHLDCVFANTVETQAHIKRHTLSGGRTLLGIYDRTMNVNSIRNVLKKVIGEKK